MPQVQAKPALIEARWVIKILIGIICGLFLLFFLVGWVAESNDTERMKACVKERTREWVKMDCVMYEPKEQ